MQVHVSHSSLGRDRKYYYAFQNVRLTREKLQFFAPAGGYMYIVIIRWVYSMQQCLPERAPHAGEAAVLHACGWVCIS